MCRFAVYLGSEIGVDSLVTLPVNSIIHQSFHSHERVEPLNGDGFGIGWYADGFPEPGVFKEVMPAWNSVNLLHLARVTRTRCLMAHVRAATPGLPVTQLNCHPFTAERLCFMHNGTVGGFRRIKRSLIARLREETFLGIAGSTDSEYVFALILDALQSEEVLEAAGDDPLEKLSAAMVVAIGQVEDLCREAGVTEPSLLNLALSDGERAVVSRYASDPEGPSNTLYLHRGHRYSCEGGICRMLPAEQRQQAVIVASEPLSEDSGWQAVEMNHLVKVSKDLAIESVKIPGRADR